MEFVALCFGSGEDSRGYRNRYDTNEGVAVKSDNSEHEDTQSPPPKKKKKERNLLMCITNIASHGGQAYKRIQGDRDAIQCETIAPFFPC